MPLTSFALVLWACYELDMEALVETRRKAGGHVSADRGG